MRRSILDNILFEHISVEYVLYEVDSTDVAFILHLTTTE